MEFFKLLKGNLADEEKSIIALSFDVMWAILTALNETSQRYSLQPNTELTGSLQLTSYFNKQLQNVSLEGFTVIELSLFLNILVRAAKTRLFHRVRIVQ